MPELEYSLKFLRSTARKQIYCDPSKIKVAIATIGDICPGMNVVVRSLVNCLEHEYKAKEIFLVKWGFRGISQN
jgi:6-phosphofructokinase 1